MFFIFGSLFWRCRALLHYCIIALLPPGVTPDANLIELLSIAEAAEADAEPPADAGPAVADGAVPTAASAAAAAVAQVSGAVAGVGALATVGVRKQGPVPPPRRRNRSGSVSPKESKDVSRLMKFRSPTTGRGRHPHGRTSSTSPQKRGSVGRSVETTGVVTRNTQLELLRRDVLRESQLQSGTANMLRVLRSQGTDGGSVKSHGGRRAFSRKLQKLEDENEAFNAKISGLNLQIRAKCSDWWFGHSLVDVASSTERALPLVVESCVNALKAMGLEEEGLFRVPGDVAEVGALRAAYERAEDPLVDMDPEENLGIEPPPPPPPLSFWGLACRPTRRLWS